MKQGKRFPGVAGGRPASARHNGCGKLDIPSRDTAVRCVSATVQKVPRCGVFCFFRSVVWLEIIVKDRDSEIVSQLSLVGWPSDGDLAHGGRPRQGRKILWCRWQLVLLG